MSRVPYYMAKEIAEKTWMIEYAFTANEHMYSYLLEGSEYALLIDTMMGWGDIAAFCKTLTDKPLRLANTHAHPDHIGGNYVFDECYIHPLELPAFYRERPLTAQDIMQSARRSSKPEYADLMEEADFAPERPMKICPVWEGDIFELGGRQIEVVEVGGHTPGSIVLIDPETRICFSGDACNGNTLMNFGSSLSVEEYMHSLLRFKRHAHKFDTLYGGHQVLTPSVIDEGIELCARVIAGTDDKEARPGMFGRTAIYAAKHKENGFGREDGKSFNMCYNPDKILAPEAKGRVIGLKPEPLF